MNKWLNFEYLDVQLKQELLEMSEAELKDAFYTDLSFGTGGIRGVVGPGTNRMNIYTLRRANVGYATFMKRHHDCPSAVIAYDSRRMSLEFAKDSAAVLATMGVKVYLFSKITPTPELSFAIRHLHTSGGIVITASHNPPQYNGYKIYDAYGCQLTPDYIDEVIQDIQDAPDMFAIEVQKYEDLVQSQMIVMLDDLIDEAYVNAVKLIQVQSQLQKTIRVVYTPLHGTGGVLASRLLSDLRYDYQTVTEQMVPDPNFSTVASPNPEDMRAFQVAMNYAVPMKADLIVATDPDADRLGIAVLHNGSYHFLSGNQTGAIMIDYLCQFRLFDGVVFNTIVTSSFGADIAKSYGLSVVSTLTGFKFIGEQMQILESNQKSFFFGYEESYGYVIKDFVRDKDSLQALVLISEITNYYKQQGLTLVDQLEILYTKYGYYQDTQVNITLTGETGAKQIESILDYFRNNDLPMFDIAVKEDYLQSTRVSSTVEVINLPKSNVIKYILKDGSWFVIRPSGTEPKMKIYVATHAMNAQEAQTKETFIKQTVLKIIESVK